MSDNAGIATSEAGRDPAPDFLAGGGEMGALMRAFDWAGTPLGPVNGWPQSLRTSVSTCLNCAFPILVWWGPDLVMLYNDEYRQILGSAKHPAALGTPGRQVWPEIWEVIGPMLRQVMERGEATRSRDLLLVMDRHGYTEETYFSFSYSPIRDETGVGGVFCPVIETTEKVIGERRLRTLSDLGARVQEASNAEEACRRAAFILEKNAADVPFALIYLLDETGAARLIASTNMAEGHAAAPDRIDFGDHRLAAAWPLKAVADANEPLVIHDAAARLGILPRGPWPEAVVDAIVLPLVAPGQARPTGFLVAGINPRRRLDPLYRSFFELAAGHVATAIANARALEEERRRADALAEIDRAKTAFFSNVSHEFRTPLTLMLGQLEEALRHPSLAGEAREGLKVSHRNGLRLLKLVNTLLDFSRVEAGRMQASFEPTDLSALTAELASSFQSLTDMAGLRLTVDCHPLPEPVHVDRDMWEKIVFNLVSNAFKFTLDGEIVVAVQARDGHAELMVRDTGIGIPERELPRIFERFHRVNTAGGRTHEGTGIGLALVLELVTLHGGTIQVGSTYGQGTTFTVLVPFGTAHLPAGRIGAARTQASTATRAEAYIDEAAGWLPDVMERPTADSHPGPAATGDDRPRVLLVDDNADMRGYIRHLLAPHYAVEAVSDGQAALEAARAQRPNLVLSDVMMPRLDGFGLLKALRAEAGLYDVPIVLLSARAGEEAHVEGLEAGADDYLVKPFSARELLARVRSNLDLAALRRQAAEAVRASEERYRALVEVSPQAVWMARADGQVTYCNQWWLDYSGLTMEQTVGMGWAQALHPEYREPVAAAWLQAAAAGGEWNAEMPLRRAADGEYRWHLARGLPERDGDGRIVRWTGIAVDIHDRRRAEDRQGILMREIDHRARNLLAVVQSIVRQTRAGTPEEYARGVLDRIQALARTHTLLAQGGWSEARLGTLLSESVAAVNPGGMQGVSLSGPDVSLSPKAAQSLAMMAHELATNATKYGALSVPTGRVEIAWWWARREGDGARMLALEWRERGGPPGEPPARRGFGSRLVERSLAAEFGGSTRLDFAAEGLRCRIDIPASDRVLAAPAEF